jgi:hypothetical protein
MKRDVLAVFLLIAAFLSTAASSPWDPTPWLADLGQIRVTIDRDYPNLDWLTEQREVSLDSWFKRTADNIRQSHSDADARRAMDGLIKRFNDGHLTLHWPIATSSTGHAPASLQSSTIATFCTNKGYDASRVTFGTAASLPGYRQIDVGGPFAAGIVNADGKNIGVVRLGAFSPQGYPSVCEQAVTKTRTPPEQPCDDLCSDHLLTEAFAVMTRSLITTIERLRANSAQLLLIDLTRNGGGTEWAEAAARIISPVPVRSAPTYVIRSEAWATLWRARAAKLRLEARRASSADRAMLLELARYADATADDLKPCASAPCSRLAQAGYASGLLAEMPAGRISNKVWAPDIFSPAQFPYIDSVWNGPVIVLVDSETWSAAEEFSALLQDNGAAIVMGTRTGGAGCGHIDGNDPVTLTHSGAKLEMPNCARLRKDGSNEVGGIVPDVPTGVRWNDGSTYAGHLTAAHLSEAIVKAEALHLRNRSTHPEDPSERSN